MSRRSGQADRDNGEIRAAFADLHFVLDVAALRILNRLAENGHYTVSVAAQATRVAAVLPGPASPEVPWYWFTAASAPYLVQTFPCRATCADPDVVHVCFFLPDFCGTESKTIRLPFSVVPLYQFKVKDKLVCKVR